MRFLLLLPFGLCLLAAACLLLATPTLNYDDLQIADWGPQAFAKGRGNALVTLLFNLDFGSWQPRTYGLSRAIQYVLAGLFGAATIPAYALLIAAHFGSGLLVYAIVRRTGGDVLTAIFGALAWIASPAVLPLLTTQHHFLYLIAPYYPLFGWLLLTADRERTSIRAFLFGALLLTLAWMLGEGVVLPIFVAVLVTALHAGTWRRGLAVFGQGAVAGLLCVLYLGYQIVFLENPEGYDDRFHLAPQMGLAKIFLHQLGQSLRAIVGLSHYDHSLNAVVGGIGLLGSPVFWISALVLIVSGLAGIRFWPKPDVARDRSLALVVVLVAISSIGVPMFFVLAGMGSPAVRYCAAFLALAPVALVVLFSAYAPRAVARPAAAVVASVVVALMLGFLHRGEVLVSAPNRALLAKLHGRVVLLRPESEFNPAFYGAIPGLTPIDANGLSNPMRSLWTAEPALKHYAGAMIANECRMVSADKAEVFLLGNSRGIVPLKLVTVEGSNLTAAQACSLK